MRRGDLVGVGRGAPGALRKTGVEDFAEQRIGVATARVRCHALNERGASSVRVIRRVRRGEMRIPPSSNAVVTAHT